MSRPPLVERPLGPPPSLQCRGLQFTWPGGPTFGPLDLDLQPGLHGLLGRNGSGKSTLLRLLCGVLQPEAGTVVVCGQSPLRAEGRRGVSFLPAEDDLPGFLTATEAWQELATLRGSQTWDGQDKLRALGVPPHAPLATLSSGQRRKAALVSALAGDPPILLLDEPLANLDTESAGRIRAWLRALRSDHVVLMSGHEVHGLAWDSVVELT